MNKMLFFLLLISAKICYGDPSYYTVVATSGLSMRKSKAINSARLNALSFGEKVEVLALHKKDTIRIDDLVGFWVEIKYKEDTGFAFSSYLFPVALSFQKYAEEEFVVLDEFEDEFERVENGTYDKLNFNVFDEQRNWYGVKLLADSTVFELLKIKLAFDYLKIQALHDKSLERGSLNNFIKLNPQTNKVYNFFIGSYGTLPNAIKSSIYKDCSNKHGASNIGRFIYPYERKRLSFKTAYALDAHIVLDSLNYTMSYLLQLKKLNENFNVDIQKENYYYNSSVEKHSTYKSPRLLWSGDLNSDSIPDFIFYTNIMDDKCSKADNTLLVSFLIDGTVTFKEMKSRINVSSFN